MGINTITTSTMISKLSLILATFGCYTQAWWDKAHLIVARIAYDKLQDIDITSYNSAVEMLAVLKNDPSVNIGALADEDNYPFVECAPFADSIKSEGYSFQSNWHFVDTPYLDESKDISKYDFTDYNTQNSSKAIEDIFNWLSGDAAARQTVTYEMIANYFDTEADRESFALRLLIHYVGDIHQPCHGMTRVDSEYPEGDRGCNSLHLKSKDGASNLHAVWDSVIYQFTGHQGLPLWDSTWVSYGKWSADIESMYPIDESKMPLAYNQPFVWADEDVGFGPQVYDGVTSAGTLSNAYVTQAQDITGSRINYAGVRLAQMVSDIFKSRATRSMAPLVFPDGAIFL